MLRGENALTDEDEIVTARRAWQGRLAEAGLAGVTWPKEFGGQGLGPIEQVIVTQEIAEAGIPGILDAIGVGMLGPTIIAHGSDEQKSETSRRCCTATRSGASSSPSRQPARTSLRSRPARSNRTTAAGV